MARNLGIEILRDNCLEKMDKVMENWKLIMEYRIPDFNFP